MEDRLTKLEILYSNQTQMVEDLSSEMFQQQKDIAGLQLQIEELKEKIESASSTHEFDGNERPPHY